MLHHRRLWNSLQRTLKGARLPVFYDPAYRLPLPTLGGITGMEARRGDFALWYLLDLKIIRSEDVLTPSIISWTDAQRVHSEALLESLTLPDTLTRVFPVEAKDLPADEIIKAFRLGCGATLEGARLALRRQGPVLNLLGGFHHAEPDKAGGFCPINDIAIAIATLRDRGYRGQINILDLDAHPPDGISACIEEMKDVWLGSISGVDWGPLPAAREILLPYGTDDGPYLESLKGLLNEMPKPELTFVIAGGDVIAGDKMGGLALTEAGIFERDQRVAAALEGQASVWLPGGGYHPRAWQLLAQTATILQFGAPRPIPLDYDPLRARYAFISEALDPSTLEGSAFITTADLSDDLGLGFGGQSENRRFLGYYTSGGLEYGLFRYGILRELNRLGYENIHGTIAKDTTGDRARIFGEAEGEKHLLVELVAELQIVQDKRVLYVHCLSLTHPKARFTDDRPQLPGQERPGLGLAREFSELLARVARRLGCAGVGFRPSHYHVAHAGRHRNQFMDPERQGRFEAMGRDLKSYPLLEVTKAVDEGRVRMNGEVYPWEPSLMVEWVDGGSVDRKAVEAEATRVHFTIAPHENLTTKGS